MLIDRINQRLKETGKAAQRVSLEATGAKETLRKILDGTTRSPRIDTIQKLAIALQTTPEWLLGASEQRHADGNGIDGLAAEETTGTLKAAPEFPQRHTMPLDVPVMGTAAGSLLRGAFQLEGGIVDYVRRPPALTGTRDIYALYVEGSSMEPQYFPGDLIYVSPHKPARLGDIVVVQCRNGEYATHEATLGIYRRKSTEGIVIAKRNPAGTEVTIVHAHIKAIHRVYTTNELFGV